MRSKRGLIVWVVALLTAVATVTPAVAAPPAGELIVTVETTEPYMWANSDGDLIKFDVTVTNKTRDTVSGITLTFPGNDPIYIGDLEKRESRELAWIDGKEGLLYTVDAAIDFDGLTPATQTEVPLGTAVALSADEQTRGTANVVMTAYPVEPCPPAAADGSFTWGPNADYTVCSFVPSRPSHWTLTTTLPKAKRAKGTISPAATVRDGVPGNWCNEDLAGPIDSILLDPKTQVDGQYFPVSGTCRHGGAGGDEMAVRNHDTFYLATWKDNVVIASPGGP